MKDDEIRSGIKRLRGEVPTGDVYVQGADGKFRKEQKVAPNPMIWGMPVRAPSRPHDWRQVQHGLVRDLAKGGDA